VINAKLCGFQRVITSTPASIKRGDESPARAYGEEEECGRAKMKTKNKPEKRDVVMFAIDK